MTSSALNPGSWHQEWWSPDWHTCTELTVVLLFKSSPEDVLIDLRERNTDVRDKHWSAASRHAPTWDRTHNLGMCPDQGLIPQPLGAWDDALTNWAAWPGLTVVFLKHISFYRKQNYLGGHAITIIYVLYCGEVDLVGLFIWNVYYPHIFQENRSLQYYVSCT